MAKQMQECRLSNVSLKLLERSQMTTIKNIYWDWTGGALVHVCMIRWLPVSHTLYCRDVGQTWMYGRRN
ncbi:MAG: hypothetical protein K2O91_09630 [Lachnospiraceae bacterium]|nr:hypothetical protein [Lachnospiraceae bacterium]